MCVRAWWCSGCKSACIGRFILRASQIKWPRIMWRKMLRSARLHTDTHTYTHTTGPFYISTRHKCVSLIFSPLFPSALQYGFFFPLFFSSLPFTPSSPSPLALQPHRLRPRCHTKSPFPPDVRRVTHSFNRAITPASISLMKNENVLFFLKRGLTRDEKGFSALIWYLT